MSRVGNRVIELPSGVEAKLEGETIRIKGPRGTLTQKVNQEIKVSIEDKKIIITRASEEKRIKALHGLTRTLIANMVEGVTKGFERRLEISGVGYKTSKEGKLLVLQMGFSSPVKIDPPEGVEFKLERTNKIIVSGIDKQLVGEMAAEVRRVRKVEPYKGKGIRYAGEKVRRKAGKVAKVEAT